MLEGVVPRLYQGTRVDQRGFLAMYYCTGRRWRESPVHVGAVFNFGFAPPSFSHHPPPAILNAITILILTHNQDDHNKMFKRRKGCRTRTRPGHKVSSDAMRVCGHDPASSCPETHGVSCVFLTHRVSFKQTPPCV